MIQQPGTLNYFLSEKEIASQKATLLLISLAGPIGRATAPTFDKLIEEVTQKSAAWIVLNLRDVGKAVERTQFPALAKLQKVIREKPAELRIFSIHPELKALLMDAGILRPNELSNNLSEALESLSPKTDIK